MSLATVFAEGSGEEGEIITFNYDASFYVSDFDLSLVRNQDILKAVLNDGKAVFYDFKFESNYVEVFLILRLESHFSSPVLDTQFPVMTLMIAKQTVLLWLLQRLRKSLKRQLKLTLNQKVFLI